MSRHHILQSTALNWVELRGGDVLAVAIDRRGWHLFPWIGSTPFRLAIPSDSAIWQVGGYQLSPSGELSGQLSQQRFSPSGGQVDQLRQQL